MAQANIRKYLTKNMVDLAQSLNGVEACGDVVSPTLTSAVEVGSGNIIRITVAAGAAMHLTFGPSAMVATTATTSPAIRLPEDAAEAVHYVISTDEYIRADVVATRVEVIGV